MELQGFWAGAARAHGTHQVRRLAAQADLSLPQLAAAGVDGLRQAGLGTDEARQWMAQRIQTRGTVLCLADDEYPESLSALEDAPPVLFVEGTFRPREAGSVAVVGTRGCSSYGRAVARHLGSALAESGFTVVSGLARGIDAAAHRGALSTGHTVAVLAHGLGHTAPASHRRLRAQLLEAGGALVTHWPDEVTPRPWQFLARNRWVAALSRAVVVVEAPTRSGALATARQANELGRDVWAVPHALGQVTGAGCLDLLGDGASVVTSVTALVTLLAGEAQTQADPWTQALMDGPDLATLSARLGMSVAGLLPILAQRELEGRVVRLPGQRYALP